MNNPIIFLAKLNGSLAYVDKVGGGSFTGSGAVRWQAAQGARTNYVHNPRLAANVNNWTNSIGTIERVTDTDFAGGTALEIAAPATSLSGGRTNGFESGWRMSRTAKTFSFDAKFVSGASDWQIYASEWNAAGSLLTTAVVQAFTPTGTVTRFSATYTPTFTGVSVVHFGVRRVAAAAGTIRISNAVIEDGTISNPSYFDGTTGAWLDPVTGQLGSAHASPSVSQAVLWHEEGTTNTVPDPSFEAAVITTNWTARNLATIAKVTVHAFVGSNGGRVSCTASVSDGILQLATSGSPAATGQTWTLQTRVRAFAAVDIGKQFRLEIVERDAANGVVIDAISPVTYTLTEDWQTVTWTYLLVGGATVAKITMGVKNQAAVANDFVLDAVQLEQKAYATSYTDGSLGTGYAWVGTAHASASTRALTVVTASTTNHIFAAAGSVVIRARWGASNNANAFAFAMNTGSAERVYLYRNDVTSKVAMGIGGNSAFSTQALTTARDTWTMLTGDWNGATARFFKDDEVINSGSAYSGLTTPDAIFAIGSQAAGVNSINGLVGPVAIVNRQMLTRERQIIKLRVFPWNKMMLSDQFSRIFKLGKDASEMLAIGEG